MIGEKVGDWRDGARVTKLQSREEKLVGLSPEPRLPACPSSFKMKTLLHFHLSALPTLPLASVTSQ